MRELYLVAHLGGVLLKLVINWWLFGCYTRRETTSVFGNTLNTMDILDPDGRFVQFDV